MKLQPLLQSHRFRWVLLLFVLCGGVAHQFLTVAGANESNSSEAAHSNDRLREGTELTDLPGTFKLTGDRATFYPLDGSGRFGGLENQTLERVANVIGEDPTPLEWLVSGVITEYKGNNYILLTRAILKTKPTNVGKPSAKSRR